MSRYAVGGARLAAALSLIPGAAFAHDLSDRYGVFLDAAIHPLTEIDHVLAFFALGLLAGQQGTPAARRSVAAFIAGLLLGVVLSTILPVSPDALRFLGGLNLASLFVLGALAAAALRLPSWLVAFLAALFGASHGLENGLDLAGALSVLSAVGILAAGLVAAAPVAVLVVRLRAGWQRVAVRVAGSWVAAIGLIVLGLRFRA